MIANEEWKIIRVMTREEIEKEICRLAKQISEKYKQREKRND